jgi:hypothetical protein
LKEDEEEVEDVDEWDGLYEWCTDCEYCRVAGAREESISGCRACSKLSASSSDLK